MMAVRSGWAVSTILASTSCDSTHSCLTNDITPVPSVRRQRIILGKVLRDCFGDGAILPPFPRSLPQKALLPFVSPFFALTPFSWHNPRKLSVHSAFNANSILCSIGSVFFHGIDPHLLPFDAVQCYLCPGPAPKQVAHFPNAWASVVLAWGNPAPDSSRADGLAPRRSS